MPWYKVQTNTEQHFCYFDTEKDMLIHFVQQNNWNIKWKKWKLKKFNYRRLLFFLKELQNALDSGFQIKQALENLSFTSSTANLANNCKAILYELEKGTPLNTILTKLTISYAQAYCELIRSDGSREDLEQSLQTSIIQLETLLDWSSRLLKSLSYPFCIIQLSLLMKILHAIFLTNKEESQLLNSVFIIVTITVQGLIFMALFNGSASNFFEKHNQSFRLAKLFALLETTRKTGAPLQQALRIMPNYFQNKQFNTEILAIYYSLKLGENYTVSFPKKWFPKEANIALQATRQGGSLDRALHLASIQHKRRWMNLITLYEKIIPAICLFVAGSFVASSLLSVYQPILELP